MRAIHRILPLILVSLAGEVVGAETTFLPEVQLTETYTDSVSIGGGIGQGESDLTSELGLVFPWLRRWKTGTLGISYTPSFVWYQEYDDLNNDQHRLNVDVGHKPDIKSDVNYRLSYTQSQAAPSLASILNEENPAESEFYFLANNTRVETFNAGINYRRQLSRGWSWAAGIGAVEARADNLDSTDPDDGFVDELEDNRTYRFSASTSRQFSKQNSAGVDYGYSKFLQDSGDTDVHELAFNYERTQAERWKFGIRVGGYTQSQDVPGAEGSEGFTGRLVAARTMRRLVMQLAATRSLTAGGNLGGTSENTFGVFSISGPIGRLWRWNASTLYGIYRSEMGNAGTRTNESANAGIAWAPPRAPIGLQLRVNYQERTYEDSAGNVQEGLSGDFTSVAASLGWRLPGYGKRAGN